MLQEDSDSVEIQAEEETEELLTTSEFILINLSRHYSIEDYSLYKYANPDESLNIFQVLMAYVVVGIPIGYMEIVLGQYTNMGMFHIKHLMPISQGMSYTFCLQVFSTTTICVILMTQYSVYALLSLVHGLSGQKLPWLECPKNYTEICYYPEIPCQEFESCINETRHLSTYVYWDEVYMKGIVSREEADIGHVPLPRLVALLITWLVVWRTMTMSFVKIKKFIKSAFIIILVLKLVQFFAFLFWQKYIMYLPQMINLYMNSFINFTAWKRAVIKVTIGMGLGDFSYIMFGTLSKRSRKTGSLMWFCGITSFFLTLMDHIVLSGATYYLCERAKLPVDRRYLLFRPDKVQHELGVLPIILANLMSGSLFNCLYFMHRYIVLLFHVMLNYSFLQLSLYQRYPVLEAYGVYIKPMFCICGFGISLLLDSKEAYSFRYDIQRVVFEFCDQFNIIVINVIVFYIYGVAKFCDDVHFMTGQQPAKYWLIGWVISPIAIIISLPIKFFDNSDIFFAYRMITIAVFYSPYMLFLAITIVQKIYQKVDYYFLEYFKLLTLLRSTDEWGPRDPTLKLYRKSFNPRVDSKRKNKSYICVHHCLIDGKVPPISDDDDETVLIYPG